MLFDLVAQVARFYGLGREVFRIRVGEFFAWIESMPEVRRVEDLQRLSLLTLAGNRGVGDKDFKRALRKMEKPVRRQVRAAQADIDKAAAAAAAANAALRGLA